MIGLLVYLGVFWASGDFRSVFCGLLVFAVGFTRIGLI